MNHVPVKSSNIISLAHDGQTLEVKFTGQRGKGTTWQYEDVPEHVYQKVLTAASVGRAFNDLVRGKYKGKQI